MLRDRDLIPGPRKKSTPRSITLAVFLGIGTAIAARQIIHTFWFFPIGVETDHMAPAIKNGSTVYINRLVKPARLKRGDILLIRHPRSPDLYLIRRVIGKAGDRIEIKNGDVHLNDRALDAPWESALRKRYPRPSPIPAEIYPEANCPMVVVKPAHLYMLADNRAQALDSRQLGQISVGLIIGKVWF